MAIARKYTKQMPFVSTPLQREVIEEAAEEGRTSLSHIIRAAVNRYFSLNDDGTERVAVEDKPSAD
jgi:hypothetical protein